MEKSPMTTLCYIEAEKKYLMLHRIYKKNDVNHDKWIGVGGHFEPGESPEECLLREVKEETGLTLTDYRFRGLITFICDDMPAEYMCLYTADRFVGELTNCDEGKLSWVEKDKITQLNLWEGDRIFLQLLEKESPFFTLKLVYQAGNLIEAVENSVISRLERYENVFAALLGNLADTESKMAELRSQGKTKTATFRQLLGKKINYEAMVQLFSLHGINE